LKGKKPIVWRFQVERGVYLGHERRVHGGNAMAWPWVEGPARKEMQNPKKNKTNWRGASNMCREIIENKVKKCWGPILEIY
jgi:hypothetical protein